MAGSCPGLVTGGRAQDLGQGVGGGLPVGLQGGNQLVQVHAFGLLRHADDLIEGARQVIAVGVAGGVPGPAPCW